MKLTRTAKEIRLVVGGESRIELLPPEVAARGKARSTKRALVGVVVIAALVAGGSYGASMLAANVSAAQLAVAQARTTDLLKQQGRFIEVKQVQAQLNTVKAAQQLGTATEITWKAYLASVQASLPAGVILTGFTVESATPLQQYAQASVPLQGERVAKLVFRATSPTLPDVQRWLNGLSQITGFVDATPGSIAQKPETGMYDATITMHINADAYAKRFVPKDSAATTDGTSK